LILLKNKDPKVLSAEDNDANARESSVPECGKIDPDKST
jgi:hypothetical protein